MLTIFKNFYIPDNTQITNKQKSPDEYIKAEEFRKDIINKRSSQIELKINDIDMDLFYVGEYLPNYKEPHLYALIFNSGYFDMFLTKKEKYKHTFSDKMYAIFLLTVPIYLVEFKKALNVFNKDKLTFFVREQKLIQRFLKLDKFWKTDIICKNINFEMEDFREVLFSDIEDIENIVKDVFYIVKDFDKMTYQDFVKLQSISTDFELEDLIDKGYKGEFLYDN